MNEAAGRLMMAAGAILFLLGALFAFGSNLPILRNLGRLPGDISVQREGFSFNFPIVTMLLVSAVLSGLLWLAGMLRR